MNPFLVTDEAARRLLDRLRAAAAAREDERRRFEGTLRGRLSRIDWVLVGLVLIVLAAVALCLYAGYLEATAPLPG